MGGKRRERGAGERKERKNEGRRKGGTLGTRKRKAHFSVPIMNIRDS